MLFSYLFKVMLDWWSQLAAAMLCYAYVLQLKLEICEVTKLWKVI